MADQKRTVELLIRAKNELGPALKSAAGDMDRLRTMSKALGASLISLGAAGLAGLSAMVAETVRAGTEIQELGERTGLTAEELSRLKFVAEQNNANLTDLTLGIKFLSKAMVGLSEDGQETSGIFKQLNIQVRNTDGTLRPVKDVFLDTADAISKVKDPAERLSYTLALFGRGGISLAGVMKLGAAEIRRLGDEAERAGLVISQDMADAADDLDDRTNKLKGSLAGLARTIGTELLPSIVPVVDKVQSVVEELGAWARANPQLAETVVKVSVALVGTGGLVVAVTALGTTMAAATPAAVAFWAAALPQVAVIVAVTGALAAMGATVKEVFDILSGKDDTNKPTATVGDIVPRTRKVNWTPVPPVVIPPKPARPAAETDKLEFWELTPAEQAARLTRDQAAVAKWVDQMLAITRVGARGSVVFNGLRPGPGTNDPGAPIPLEQADVVPQFSAAANAVAQLRQQLPELGAVGVQSLVQLGAVVGTTLVENFRNLGAAVRQWGIQAVASIASVIAQALILKGLTALIPGAGSALKFLGFSQGGVVPARAAGGGIITGGVPGRDSVPVLAQSGEGFLSRGDMSKLDQLLRQGGGGGNHFHIHAGAFLGDRGAALEFARMLAGLQREQLTGTAF